MEIYAIVIKLWKCDKNYCKKQKRNVRYRHQNENITESKTKKERKVKNYEYTV